MSAPEAMAHGSASMGGGRTWARRGGTYGDEEREKREKGMSGSVERQSKD